MLRKLLALVAVPVAVSAAVACSGTGGTQDTSSQDDALSVCAKGTTLKGIDVSYYQAKIDWPAVKASGHAFAFIRVSDGIRHEDPKFDANWAGAKGTANWPASTRRSTSTSSTARWPISRRSSSPPAAVLPRR